MQASQLMPGSFGTVYIYHTLPSTWDDAGVMHFLWNLQQQSSFCGLRYMMIRAVSEVPCRRCNAYRCSQSADLAGAFYLSWFRYLFRGTASHVFVTSGEVLKAHAISVSVGCGEVLISAYHAASQPRQSQCFSLSLHCIFAGTRKISRRQRPSHQGKRASRSAPTGGWEAWSFQQPSALES